jgi:hypothetical protein
MIAVPPTTFDCDTSGKMSAPRTEVILQRAMLGTLPLLVNLSKSTSSKEQATAQLELPCSVWGFVSLLLLLEGNVKLSHWFQGDCDTTLPIQTLLVCARGCSSIAFIHPAYSEMCLEAGIEAHSSSEATDSDSVQLCHMNSLISACLIRRLSLEIELGRYILRLGCRQLTTIVLGAVLIFIRIILEQCQSAGSRVLGLHEDSRRHHKAPADAVN